MKKDRKKYMKDYLLQWRFKNKEWIKIHNKELVDSGYFKKWRKDNKESVSLSERKHRKKYKIEILLKNKKRQERLKELLGSHTLTDWVFLKAKYKQRCAICSKRKKLTKDHIIPIWEKNSSNDIMNIRPLCGSCNSSEGAKYQNSNKGRFNNVNRKNTMAPAKKQRISGKQKKVTSPNKKNTSAPSLPKVKKFR